MTTVATTTATTRSNLTKPPVEKGHPLLWVAAFILANVGVTAAVVAGIAQFVPSAPLPHAIKVATDYLGPGGRLTLISIVAVAVLSARRLFSQKGIHVERGTRSKISDPSESGLDEFRSEIGFSLYKEKDYIQLAEGYLKAHCLDEACKAIDRIFMNDWTKEALLEEVANAYLKKGERKQAVRVIQKIYMNNEIKNTFLVKVAESYYHADDLTNALSTINKVFLGDQRKVTFLEKVANAYLKKREREQAVRVIQKISMNNEIKNTFLVKVAESYYYSGDLKNALRIIGKIISDDQTKEAFIIKIANTYLDRDERDQALNVIRSVYGDSNKKHVFLVKLSQSYYLENNEREVLKLIEIVAGASLEEKIVNSTNYEIYFQIIRESICNNNIGVFISQLAKSCFAKTEAVFVEGNTQAILREIRNHSTTPEVVQDFLNLKDRSSQPRTNFRPPPNGGYSSSQRTPSNPNIAEYYRILGLKPSASKGQVNAAYKKLALIYHPDRVKKQENESEVAFTRRKKESLERFKLIVGAKDKLVKILK